MYRAPEINTLKPMPTQAMVVDYMLEMLEDAAPAFWAKGRGAGKSTAKAMIAQAILDSDEHPLYEVRAVVHDA